MKLGIGIFVLYQNKLMLILRDDKPEISNPCRYALVGGAVDPGEEFIETACREFEEETGISLPASRFKLIGIEEVPMINQQNGIFVIELSDTEYSHICLAEGQRYDFHDFCSVSILHLVGPTKYGLGGAIARLMNTFPHIVENIVSGIHVEAFNFQT